MVVMEGCGDEVVVGISFRAGGGVEMGTTVNGAKTKEDGDEVAT